MTRHSLTSRRLALVAGALAGALAAPPAALAQPGTTTTAADTAAQAASTRRREPLFTRRDGYMTLAATGGTVLLMQLDRPIQNKLYDPGFRSESVNDFANDIKSFDEHRFLFTSAGMYLVGRAGAFAFGRNSNWHDVADAGLHSLEANAISTLVLVSVMRGLSGRSRPAHTAHREPFDFELGRGWEEGPFRSFPSLHSTGAFSFAGALTAEMRRHKWGGTKFVAPLLFATATTVGLGRMYQDQHWASDVAAAAFIGTGVGMKTVKWHHTHEGNRYDRWLLGAAPMPGDGQLGLVVGRRW